SLGALGPESSICSIISSLLCPGRRTAKTQTQLPHPVINIKQTRHPHKERGTRGEIHNPTLAPSFVPPQQHPDDRHHLKHGSHFANAARAHADFSHNKLNDNHTNQNQKITPNNHATEPKQELSKQRTVIKTQQHDTRHQEQFIDQRVENHAQFTSLVVT